MFSLYKIKFSSKILNQTMKRLFARQTSRPIKEETKIVAQESTSTPSAVNIEYEQIKMNCVLALTSKDKVLSNLQNYDQVFSSMMELIKYYSKKKDSQSLELFNSTLVYLEKNAQMFSLVQLLQLSIEMGKNNIGSVVVLNAFSHSIERYFITQKSKIMTKVEDAKLTGLLFHYFSVISEISMMEPGMLNFLLDYFSHYSASLIKENISEIEVKNLTALYDFFWATSLSVASILEKRRQFNQFKAYVNTVSPVIDTKGGRGLNKLLAYLNSVIALDKNFSENTASKSRLFRALYYLKLEGIEMKENLTKFLDEFAPFHLMNLEKSVKSSTLELKFQKMLDSLNVKYQREKKIPFCSLDFLISEDIVIEVNGPSHYVLNSPILIAKDLLKLRVLRFENYDVTFLSYEKIQKQEQQLRAELTNRFQHLKDPTNRLMLDLNRQEKIVRRNEIERNSHSAFSCRSSSIRVDRKSTSADEDYQDDTENDISNISSISVKSLTLTNESMISGPLIPSDFPYEESLVTRKNKKDFRTVGSSFTCFFKERDGVTSLSFHVELHNQLKAFSRDSILRLLEFFDTMKVDESFIVINRKHITILKLFMIVGFKICKNTNTKEGYRILKLEKLV